MTLQQIIGHYRINAKLGEGGMGEVYRATDTKLGRDVAIKILPASFARDPARMVRFEREAKALASLNHPHIAQIYGVEEGALVIELVEGEPLKGPLPIKKAVEYAGQILDALDAAHKKGIVHRDLKPANILVTRQGIKLLDFGLAKIAHAPLAETDETLTQPVTRQGQIVGTLQYMSPEQLNGKEVDSRSDLFSFGCVLYEMLSGKRAFDGKSAASVIAAVLEREPPSLKEIAPPVLDQIARRCVAKDPEQRWQGARDLKSAVDLVLEPQPNVQPAGGAWSRLKLAIGVAAICAILGGLALWSLWRGNPAEQRPVHFQVTAPTGTTLLLSSGTAISPDGRTIAFVANTEGRIRIWTRRLDSITARELPDTDGAQYPFWSPDSRSLGFFADGKLKRIDLAGSSSSIVAESVTSARGGTWNQQGNILFARGTIGGLYIVPASGGVPVSASALDAASHETSHRWPQFLPDGRHFIYLSFNNKSNQYGLYLGSLGHPSQRTRILERSNGGWYLPARNRQPESLLWLSQESLVKSRLYANSGRITGDASPVAGAEVVYMVSGTNYPGISASNDGTILVATGVERYNLSWFSRKGQVVGTVGQPDHFTSVRISPDATSAGISVSQPSGHRLAFTIDFARGVQTRFPSGDISLNLIWTPDGRRIIYYPLYGHDIFERNASGAGEQETVLHSSRVVFADDLSPDGRLLLYEQTTDDNHTNLWVVPRTGSMAGERQSSPYLQLASNQINAQFSPDGKWVAYTSDESGKQQVYVQSFPASDQAKWQVSIGGGDFARWRRDGKELFYRAPDGNLMGTPVRSAGHGLEFGTPVSLFAIPESAGQHTYPYDVAPDGLRILTFAKGNNDSTVLKVLLNQSIR